MLGQLGGAIGTEGCWESWEELQVPVMLGELGGAIDTQGCWESWEEPLVPVMLGELGGASDSSSRFLGYLTQISKGVAIPRL